jgi:hypothetical protein
VTSGGMKDVITPLPSGAMTCALIKDGVVINMIVASPDDLVPDDCILIPDPPSHVTIGTKFDGTTFEDPPEVHFTGEPRR